MNIDTHNTVPLVTKCSHVPSPLGHKPLTRDVSPSVICSKSPMYPWPTITDLAYTHVGSGDIVSS